MAGEGDDEFILFRLYKVTPGWTTAIIDEYLKGVAPRKTGCHAISNLLDTVKISDQEIMVLAFRSWQSFEGGCQALLVSGEESYGCPKRCQFDGAGESDTL